MMNDDRASIGARVKTLLAERLQVPDATAIDDDTTLTDLGLDSTAILNLVVGLEDEFGIEIPDREISPDNFGRVDAISRYVAGRLGR
jgi:D-alanine--poly(phosphoribitol) ligase subunit 2